MTQHHLEFGPDEDRSALVLRMVGTAGTLFSARLEAPELDDLIRGLSDARAQLTEAVAPELDLGARITNTVVDPAYIVGKNSQKGQALLALRHPGLGWLGFQLRRSVVEAMVERLQAWLRGDLR